MKVLGMGSLSRVSFSSLPLPLFRFHFFSPLLTVSRMIRCAIFVCLQRSSGELASYQQKMFRIDDHVGIAIAGLTSDARVLRSVMPNFSLMNLLENSDMNLSLYACL